MSDRAQGAFWILVGGAIFYASWTMDRLGNLGVKEVTKLLTAD